MRVGIPAEIKTEEYRVAITPVGARELTGRGHTVYIQKDAGVGSSIPDGAYHDVGAEILETADQVFNESQLILKVKEPQLTEIAMLRRDQVLFTYLHLAAYPAEATGLINSGVTAIAYETVELPSGALPLLAPMSEIAGRMATQAGAHLLERPNGGRGILLGGAAGVPPARVLVLGAGSAGTQAAMIAAGMGAEVIILDINIDRLRHIDEIHRGRMVTVRSSMYAIEQYLPTADLVIGAVLVAGARAPIVVTAAQVAEMKSRSVVVDISIDQGGCIETSRETSHSNPTYDVGGVTHYAVGNIPGAVPNTATYALTNATLPYVVALAEGWEAAVTRHPELLGGVNVVDGKITNRAVADSLEMEYQDPATAMAGS